MKSKKSEQIQVEWLIQQIRDLDSLIAMHQSGGNDFMANQYVSRRLKYFKELISLLVTSEFNATGQETFPLIHALTSENYIKPAKVKVRKFRKSAFDRTLEFYQKHSSPVVAKSSSRWIAKRAADSEKKSAKVAQKIKSPL